MDRVPQTKEIGANETRSDGPKKVYAEPKLTVHGNVEEITKAGGSNNVDALLGTAIG